MKNTYTPSEKELKPSWHLIDAQGKILGKVAVEAANMLTGKNKPIYTPNINTGDKVVIINAEKVAFTGGKKETKIYYRYTGYPGGIKSQTLDVAMIKKPVEVVRTAVNGMLPKNKLRKVRMANLYIYKDDKHPHTAQLNK